MEDDSIESSGGGQLVFMALAALAIVLGGAGLYFGLSANQKLSTLTATMEAGSGEALRMEKQLETVNVQATELSAKIDELGSALARQKTYGNMSERAIKALETALKEDRVAIQKLSEQIVELGTRTTKPTSSTTITTSGGSDGESRSGSTSGSGGGIYTIESGDTFAKIAAKAGVSLQTILDLNPDVDPRRLRIGQVINLPAN